MNRILLTVCSAVLLVGCAALTLNAGKIAGGFSAVASAPQIAEEIQDCIAGDQDAYDELVEPFEFFSKGQETILSLGKDTQVLQLVKDFPDYYEQIPNQWNNIWAVLDGFDCSDEVTAWRVNSEEAFQIVDLAVRRNDQYQQVCGLYEQLAPIAVVFGTPVPTQLPACGS